MKIDKLVTSLVLVTGLSVHGAALATCEDLNPLVLVTSIGGGQSPTVNKTLTTTFRGHIMTTTGLTNQGKNVVKICPGTTVEFSSQSTYGGSRVGPDCSTGSNFGVLAIGEKVSCNDKNLGGRDTDTFSVKAGR